MFLKDITDWASVRFFSGQQTKAESIPVVLPDEQIAAIAGGDRELVVSTYRVKTAFTGASAGDTITMTQIIDVSSAPSTVSTIWRNQTTAADLAGAPSAANLELVGSTALTDAQLRASAVNVSVTPLTLTNVSTSAYAASLIVSAVAAKLYGVTGYNSGPAQFIQIHDVAALPIDTSVPVITFAIPATSNFALDFGESGRNFTTGIVICNSSTAPTKTIGAADCWFDAQKG